MGASASGRRRWLAGAIAASLWMLFTCRAPDGSSCVRDLGGSIPAGLSIVRAERRAAVGDHTCLIKLAPATPATVAVLLARLPADGEAMASRKCPWPSRVDWWAESQAPTVSELYGGSRDAPDEGSTDFWYVCVDRMRSLIYVVSGNT